ncbi:MAG: hypothetical protein WD226_07775 [Planctomycetota bacterium]
MNADQAGARRRSTTWLGVVLALALLPFVGRLGTPFLSDDAAILRYVHLYAWGSDAFSGQFGMLAVRFWRPVVTLSWDVQEALFGADPMAFRLLNVAAHLSTVALGFVAARRLGLAVGGAAVAALGIAWFPFAGGTVLWIAGRTDVFVTLLLVGGLAVGLGPRPAWAAAWMLVAAATKETGFVLPAWIALFVWAREGSVASGARAASAALTAAVVGLVLRRLALGVWVGGYPHGDAAELVGSLGAAAGAWIVTVWPAFAALAVAALVGWYAGSARPRVMLAGLFASAGAALPLLPLLRDGELEATNRRLLAPSLAALALALAAAWSRSPRRARPLLVGVLAVTLGSAGVYCLRDVMLWQAAAEHAAARVARIRNEVAGASGLPVLIPDLPAHRDGAYLFAFGTAQRFQAPFPPSPVEVWPERPLFGFRDSVRARADDALPLAVRLEEPLVLDERALQSGAGSPVLHLESAAPADARLEVLLFTPSGYEVATNFEAGGGGADAATLDLRRVVLARGPRTSLADAWLQAVDLGAERMFLEFRFVANGEVLAASEWLELRWEPTFPAVVARALGYR